MEKEEITTNDYLKGIVLNLPDSPGIYQYLNSEGTIIYVGKAKNLKRRVSSYFNREHPNGKTRLLVSKIADIRYIVVKTEEDALLLENNLIKKYKPRYNVLLKDDKTYPSICVSNEYFPRIFKTRQVIRNGSSYYGPYSHMPSMLAVMDLIKKLYPIRTCKLNLSPENIRAGKFNVCLEYHIKNCKGPCIGQQSHEEYMKNIGEIKNILKGDTQIVSDLLMEEMQALAAEMKFEEAQKIKEKYDLIENYRSKSEVVNSIIHNVDVFSIEMEENSAYINYLHITNGCINQAFTFEYKKRLNETKEELLQLGIIEMRERYKSTSREIIVPFELDMEMNNVSFTVPQRGEKKHLLDLSVMNVKQYKVDRLKQAEKLNPEQRSVRLMKEIQEQLHMKKLPNHIECFDNSNIQGSDAVAACVVFKKAKPSKKEYQKYIIKTVTGPDDYASMKEVVRRRYSRAIEEGSPPARPHHYRRWKGANGSGERSDRGRTSSGYPHSRTGQRPQAPHLGIVIRIPSADHRCEAKHSLVPSVGKHTERGTPLRHHLPPGQTKQESGGVRFGQYQGNRRKKKDRPAENIQKRQPHQASLTGRDCSRGR